MKYFYELTISSSPHVHSPVTTQTIMRDVLIALAPAAIGGVYFFGLRALMVMLISVAGCVFFEWLCSKMMKFTCKVYDLSAIVTGVLIAFVCPVTVPYWMVLIGDFFAIVVVKQLFGGVGRNIVNPVIQYYQGTPVNYFDSLSTASKLLDLSITTIRNYSNGKSTDKDYSFDVLESTYDYDLDNKFFTFRNEEHLHIKGKILKIISYF